MAKPKQLSKTGKTGPMFRESPCVGDHNSHSLHDYEPRYPKHEPVVSFTGGGYEVVEGMDEGIASGVRRQVENQIGQRNGTMSFRSLISREKR